MFEWVWPVAQGTITSRLGEARPYGRHEGVDIAPASRADLWVRAVGPGRVVRVGFMADGYGNYVVVRHPDGSTSLYGHLREIRVREGETVMPGSVVGVMGSTGMATGTHLHLTIKDPRGRVIDPLKLTWSGRKVEVKPPTPQARFSRYDRPLPPPPPKPHFTLPKQGSTVQSAAEQGSTVLTVAGPKNTVKWPKLPSAGDVLGLDQLWLKIKLAMPDVVGFILGLVLIKQGLEASVGDKLVRVAIQAQTAIAGAGA